jgi:hypothetical protein
MKKNSDRRTRSEEEEERKLSLLIENTDIRVAKYSNNEGRDKILEVLKEHGFKCTDRDHVPDDFDFEKLTPKKLDDFFFIPFSISFSQKKFFRSRIAYLGAMAAGGVLDRYYIDLEGILKKLEKSSK